MQETDKFEAIQADTDVFAEEEYQEAPVVKRDTTKIYFFIMAIAALIATNVYFYIKYQASEERAVGINTEKVYMQDEIDRIEAELNRLTQENTSLSIALSQSQDSVRRMISDLRVRLNQQNLTSEELEKAQVEIYRLREEVIRYKDELAHLKRQNAILASEKDSLKEEVALKSTQLSELEEENMGLADQIKSAAVLKLSNINIMGIRERSGNRENVDNKARRVDRFRIVFSIVDNPLVPHGMVNVYMRVIDPNGNLRTNGNQSFELSGNPMQYTDKAEIAFTNQGENYTIEWVDPNGFKKGTYTIVLYTDNSTMGRSSIVLN